MSGKRLEPHFGQPHPTGERASHAQDLRPSGDVQGNYEATPDKVGGANGIYIDEVYFGRSRGGVYGNVISRQIGGWAVGLLIIGLLPGINNWGHGGGFLAGIALGWILGYQERHPEGLGQRLLAGVCALTTAAVLAWSAGFAIYYRLLG